jgi:hypothetical protein
MGQYERPLIALLANHFKSGGYRVFSHVRLNVALSPIVSDIDLLLLKNGELTLIEVKSSHDKFSRASSQIQGVSEFVDYAYVATDRLPTMDWTDTHIGLILANGDEVLQLVRAKKFRGEPSRNGLFQLQKKCLCRMAGVKDAGITKFEIVDSVHANWDAPLLRECVKCVVVCGGQCETDCPIRKFTKPPSS